MRGPTRRSEVNYREETGVSFVGKDMFRSRLLRMSFPSLSDQLSKEMQHFVLQQSA